MTQSQWIAVATLSGALGMWLLLPRGGNPGRWLGAALVAGALGVWTLLAWGVSGWQMPLLGGWVAQGVFGPLAGVTLISAIAAVSLRNPVYCAIWFGMSLLGTAGLFLFAGAQFLAVATVVVYAGAILVTFLFVLMLAQPRGRAAYDRTSWEALMSAALGMVIVGILATTVCGTMSQPAEAGQTPTVSPEVDRLARQAGQRSENILAEQHVARFGAELFGRHLIAIEVAGTLLLAALVGAAVIVAQSRETQSRSGRQGQPSGNSP